MTFKIQRGTFVKSTAGAPVTQTIDTGTGIEIRFIHFWTEQQVGTGFSSEDQGHTEGWSDGMDEISVGGGCAEDVSTTNTSRHMAESVLSAIAPTGAVNFEGQITELGGGPNVGKFTVRWNTNNAIATQIYYEAFCAGPGIITDIEIGSFLASDSTGNQAVTGLGFEPNWLQYCSIGRPDVLPETQDDNMVAVGNAVSDTQRNTVAYYMNDNGADTISAQTDLLLRTLKFGGMGGPAEVQVDIDFVSFDVDGWTHNMVVASNDEPRIGYVAVRFNPLIEIDIGVFAQPTSASIVNTSTTNKSNSSIFFRSQNRTVTGTIIDDGHVRITTGIGNLLKNGSSPSDEQVTGFDYDDSVDPTDSQNMGVTDKAIKFFEQVSSLKAEANLIDSDISSDFRLDWTTADAVARSILFTAYSFEAEIRTLTHTTDSTLKGDQTVTHTTDSFLKAINMVTHETDSTLKALDQTVTHTTDSEVVFRQNIPFTTDSTLKLLGKFQQHTTDATLKQIDNELAHTTDSILLATQTLTHTTDSVLLGKIPVTHTTDSILKGANSEIHTTDSTLKLLDNELTHTTDSYLLAIRTLTHTTDSILLATQTLTHTTDSTLKLLDIELAHTTDSILLAIQTLTHTTDSYLEKVVRHTTDSTLKQLDTLVTHTTNSVFEKLGLEVSHTTDSVLGETEPGLIVTHTTDSVLKKIDNLLTHTTDSTLTQLANLVTHTTDSVLGETEPGISITHTTDSILLAIQPLDHFTNSILLAIQTRTHTTDSVLGETEPGISVIHTTDSTLKALDNELTHTTDSVVAALRTRTHTTDSVLGETEPGISITHTTDSTLKKLNNELTHTTDSVLGETEPGISVIHTTDSLLLAIQTLTHTTDSVFKEPFTVQHTTDTNLINNNQCHLLTEDGGHLLQEDEGRLLLEKCKRVLGHTTDSQIGPIANIIHTTDSIIRERFQADPDAFVVYDDVPGISIYLNNTEEISVLG